VTAFPSKQPLVPKARVVQARRRASLAPLIGRDALLERVTGELRVSRLVTLTGPPGIGKTRLALACLATLASDHRDSWFCDLSSVTTEEELQFAVLTLFRDPFEGEHLVGGLVEAHAAEALAEVGRALLVLDNFEQIVFAAKTVERFCEAAPELTVLVTSRERLAVEGEVVVELSPLAFPASDDDARAVAESDAVKLFVKRARDAGGFVGDDTKALARIVRRLDGIPLAIELAAARTRILSVGELADRLEAGEGLLSGPRRLAESRHATLANAIEWSWALLSPTEQVALARCSVFAGDFALDAAEKVVGEGAVDLLGALRDKSLLHSVEGGRLALYVSVRDYALAKLRELEGSDCGQTRMRHALAFDDLARRFNGWRNLQESAPEAFLHAALRREKENLTNALAFARSLREDEPNLLLAANLAVAVALLQMLPGDGCIEELSKSLDSLPRARTAERALLLMTRQSVYGSLGRYDECLADLAALRSMTDVPRGLLLLALIYEGIQLRYQGHPGKAWISHAAAAEELERSDLLRLRAMNAACMGRLQFDLGDAAASRLYNEQAIALSDSIGDSWLGALALANLAQLEQAEQAFERSEDLFQAALARLRNVGEVYEAIYSGACGDLFFEWGKHDVARRWYAESERFFRGVVAHRHATLALAASAALEAQDGDLVRARALLTLAKRSASHATNRVVDVGLALHAASVEIAGSDDATRTSVVAEWQKRLDRAQAADDPWAEIIATSFDARFAFRMARCAVARFASLHVAVAPTLRVARDGRWFEIGDAPRVELLRRGALRRILAALAEHHEVHRDCGLKQTELVSAGWPGERVLVDAAATRVRVAIATLRQLGLRSTLLTRDDGYVLDKNTRVEIA
jgi:predicted ATPase